MFINRVGGLHHAPILQRRDSVREPVLLRRFPSLLFGYGYGFCVKYMAGKFRYCA